MRLLVALEALELATAWLLGQRGTPDALGGATAYLKLVGDVVGGWLLAKGAVFAAAGGGSDDKAWQASKASLARVFAEQVLTGAPGLAEAVRQGAAELIHATPETLGA
jgi:hypothetical protein